MSGTSGNHEICFEDLETALAARPEVYGRLFLIAFGFPCQDISIGNPNGKGLEGERSGLFFECMRIVRLLQPEWVLIENVPRLLSINGGRCMWAVLNEMAQCGYGWAYRVLDSQYFGVAQRRRRLFIVGRFGGIPAPEILYEPEGDQRHVPANDEASSLSLCLNTRTGCLQDSSVETFIAKTLNTGGRGNNYALLARCVNTGQRSGSGATQETYIAEPHTAGKGKTSRVSRWMDGPRGCVIGNAVTVTVAEWIGRRIIAYGN